MSISFFDASLASLTACLLQPSYPHQLARLVTTMVSRVPYFRLLLFILCQTTLAAINSHPPRASITEAPLVPRQQPDQRFVGYYSFPQLGECTLSDFLRPRCLIDRSLTKLTDTRWDCFAGYTWCISSNYGVCQWASGGSRCDPYTACDGTKTINGPFTRGRWYHTSVP